VEVDPRLVDADLGILLMVEEYHWDQHVNSSRVADVRVDGGEGVGEVLWKGFRG